MKTEGRRPLTTGQASKMLNVNIRTVLDWVNKGVIRAYKTPGKHCRIQVKDFVAFCNQYGMPVPEGVTG